MPELEVPDEFHDWPFDAKRFVLAEAKTVEDLREEIDSLVGLNHEDVDGRQAGQFRKDQLAAIVMALGGPQEDGHVRRAGDGPLPRSPGGGRR